MQENEHYVDDADWQLLQVVKGKILDDVFDYTFPTFTNIAVGATQQQLLQFQADSFFRWEATSYVFNLANATYTYATRNVPNASVTFTDSGSGRQLMNASTPVPSIAGFEGRPYNLRVPKLINPASTIVAVVLNFDAAVTTGQLIITLHGRKMYNLK